MKWTPTGKELPKKSGDYLFTLFSPAYHDTECDMDFEDEYEVVYGSYLNYEAKGIRFWSWDTDGIYHAINNEHCKEPSGYETFVIAWMEIPKPYKREEK